jgi:[NiFe] hydrogenase diaphorase moiety large subunit
MFRTEREKLDDELKALVEKHGGDRTALIPVIQELQRKRHHVSDYAMQVIAHLLQIHPVEVYGVVSFYSFLHDAPQGKFVVRLCRTVSCDMQGKDRVARQLENDLGIRFGETTPDGKFSLEWANCIGMCDQGPALLVNERVYTQVTPDKVQEIIAEHRRFYGIHAVERREEHLA